MPQGATYSGATCNDGACPRNTNWIGKVALAYPSDYGFAVGEDVRSTCLEKKPTDYENDNCHTSQWISSYGWLLSPASDYSHIVYGVASDGLFRSPASSEVAVHPAFILKSDVSISRGSGTESDPFILG